MDIAFSIIIFFLFIIIILSLFILIKQFQNEKQMALDNTQLLQALTDIGAQLNKGIAEVIAAMQNAGNVPPEVEAKVNELKGIAQQLDDLNADAPQP